MLIAAAAGFGIAKAFGKKGKKKKKPRYVNYGVVRNPDALYYIPYGATGKDRIISNTANILKANVPGGQNNFNVTSPE